MFIFFGVLFLMIGLICVTCETYSAHVTCFIIGVIMFLFGFIFNPTESYETRESVSLYSIYNGYEISISGSLFYSSSESTEYLVYWTEEKNYKKRVKLKVEWEIIEVYESNHKEPCIEFIKEVRTPATTWAEFVDTPRDKITKIKLYVPEGTIIPYMTLD